MQLITNDLISALAKDIKAQIPDSFEKKYYEKISYSGKNQIIELEKDLLHDAISFEVAFVHIAIFFFNKCFNIYNSDYFSLLKRMDTNLLFSWYCMKETFIANNLKKVDIRGFSNIYELINQHDTFIDKEIKKKLGQFYTPTNIVQRMSCEIKENLKCLTIEDKLIDPACGTGIFIVEMIEVLMKRFQPAELIKYIKTSIFAYDVNPFAVIATKLSIAYILLEQFPNEMHSIFFENDIFVNIRWKNTITEPDDNMYTVIVGNPPYFKLNSELIKDIEGYKEIVFGQPNIYSFFMYWAIRHLKKNGVMSFVVPQSMRSGLYFKNLRSKIKDLRIKALIHIESRQNIFDRAEQAVLIICLENKPVLNSKTKIQFYNGNDSVNADFRISRTKLMMDIKNNNIFIICKSIKMYDILDKVFANNHPLDTQKMKFSTGLFVWNQHKKEIVDKQEDAIPIIYGGNVQPLLFDFSLCSINEERKQYALITEKSKAFVLEGKRLLVQRTTNFEKDIRLKSCIISDGFLENNNRYFLENHVNFLSSTDKDDQISLETMYFCLGILNSKLINYIFASISGNTQVSANELNTLPVPDKKINAISQFVNDHLNELKNQQQELDLLVCDAYGLSEEETSFIINY